MILYITLSLNVCKISFGRVFVIRTSQIGAKNAQNLHSWKSKIFQRHFYGVRSFLTISYPGYPDVPLTLNFHMQARKQHFGGTIHLKFSPRQRSPKITKTAKSGMFDPVYPFWWAYVVKIIANYVWNEFWDVPAQKVLIKICFSFLPEKPWFFRIFFSKSLKSSFLGPKIQLDGLAMWF